MSGKHFDAEEKIELINDEDLDLVVGGAATTYFSAPYANSRGDMCVSTLTVSGKVSYDPGSRQLTGRGIDGDGMFTTLTVPASKLDAFKERLQQRGNSIVDVGFAGPLL